MNLTLVDKKKETTDVESFIFTPNSSDGKPINWTAGQFMIYKLDHQNPDIRGKQRFFTNSAAPFEKHIVITTHIEKEKSSSFKIALNNLKIGEEIEVKGPDGDFIVENPNKQYVFIAGGIGITPFRSIIADLNHKKLPLNITLLYTNKTDEFPFKNDLEDIKSKNSNFRINYIVSPKHIDKELIKQKVPNLNEVIFYVSGPEPMIEILSEMLLGIGIKEESLKQDFFPGYQAI